MLRLFFLTIIVLYTIDDIPKDKSVFISPVKIPLALSANFGELRIDHYHSGLDIKTQGVTGKEVVAAAKGYVYRIGVSPGGFGKALYIKHPTGYSTVYGHLESFSPDIEEYVIRNQYDRKSFTVTLFPPADKFPVNQGDVIAYSGNSGGSSGPHLHYEIRKSDTEEPVNPLLFEFGIGDDIRPVAERLVIYPAAGNTRINGRNSAVKLNLTTSGNGRYFPSFDDEITISGAAGFGIKAYDLLNDSYNKCAVYSIELRIDSVTKFRYVMDRFAFSDSRYINSHIDYESYIKERIYYERAFVLPNDRLPLYRDVTDRGIFNFADSGRHRVELVLSDINKNMSSVSFFVKSEPPAGPGARKIEDNVIPMPYNRSNRFRAENITINIPSGAIYDTIFFSYKRDKGTPLMYSDVHYIHNKLTPLHKAYSISIKPDSVPAGKASKLLIIQLSDDFIRSSIGGTMTDGYLTADATSFGMFFVGIDTIPPLISANGLTGEPDLTGRRELRIKITDDISGIKSYEPAIDGKWALFEYDQKNNVLIYRFDSERITRGTRHDLVLRVTDNRDNQSSFSGSFKW